MSVSIRSKYRARSSVLVVVALALTAASASAQHRMPITIAAVGQMDCCVDCPFTVAVVASISAHDVGGGLVEATICVLTAPTSPAPRPGWSSYAPLPLTITGTGRDVHVRVDGPEAENVCTLHARIAGVPRGTHGLHLEGVREMRMAAPLGRIVPAGDELAHATVTVR